MRHFVHAYNNIISVENLLLAWQEFLKGKGQRKDVQEFERNLMGNIFLLNFELKNKTYCHSAYSAFNISDPKPRNIHKASVKDRLLHHAIYRILYPYFNKKFIHDSYSCRLNKGTHKAINRFTEFHRRVSRNNTRTCWVLKCDIKKFFANIDHQILKQILSKTVFDRNALWLLSQVIDSFPMSRLNLDMKGLPLGNLTSQLLVNVYMNEFDQYVKRELKAKYYIRYADDFIVLHEDKKYLERVLQYTEVFLKEKLKLELHPNKIHIQTIASGVDFLGWVHFPKHRVPRTSTKRRMLKNINRRNLPSYLGLIKHGSAHKLSLNLGAIIT